MNKTAPTNLLLNFQIAIETATQCGGDCTGCALTAIERHTPSEIKKEALIKKLETAMQYIQTQSESNQIESITLFFGQGDHFLLSHESLACLQNTVGEFWPEHLKEKTVFLLTASAITKKTEFQSKAHQVKNIGLSHQCNWFIQVVFDPKKMHLHYYNGYLENILFLKEVFGMIEITVNLSKDIPEAISPKGFVQFLKDHQFNHVEFNLVTSKVFETMWKNDLPSVMEWLKDFIKNSWHEQQYEINVLSATIKKLLKNREDSTSLEISIGDQAIYISESGCTIPSQSGPIGNVTPLLDRSQTKDQEYLITKKINSHLFFDFKKPCHSCEFRRVCTSNGVLSWKNHMPKISKEGCPWGLKEWYQMILNLTKKTPKRGLDRFNKNPIQGKTESIHYFYRKQ